WTMHRLYKAIYTLPLTEPLHFILPLFTAALAWFFVNTATLAEALALHQDRSFWAVWREGIALSLLNFMGSAAAAGLISIFYQRVGFLIFFFSVPIAIIIQQLYHFYVQKYLQAQKHIAELNKLYLQTVEALASAVDAKDRYTHGHIRRVQAYAAKMARLLGTSEDSELLAIQAGALLHDIGKIAIPEYI